MTEVLMTLCVVVILCVVVYLLSVQVFKKHTKTFQIHFGFKSGFDISASFFEEKNDNTIEK